MRTSTVLVTRQVRVRSFHERNDNCANLRNLRAIESANAMTVARRIRFVRSNFELGIAPHASGSVLVSMGNTRVICGVMIEEIVPRWMKEQGVTGGWLTAEYSMLPYSTTTRKPRDIAKGKLDGRSTEIQRLIGRSLRAVVDLEKLGPRTMWVDCDVLQADGGTRTAAITGASLAVAMACRKLADEKKIDAPPIRKLVGAISAGILDGVAIARSELRRGQGRYGRL